MLESEFDTASAEARNGGAATAGALELPQRSLLQPGDCPRDQRIRAQELQ
jgi:hypothetical protein